MQTDPIYMTDPYIKVIDSKIIQVHEESMNQYRLILDKTIFYPIGGGQATDQGIIKDQNGIEYEVFQVMIKDGEINHFVKCETKPIENTEVHLEINWDRRYKNMKIHSAGHLIDFAIFMLGYSPKILVPLKGDHNKNPHIMYQGQVDHDFQNELQTKVNQMISSNVEFRWEFESFDKLKEEAIYLQPGLPLNKPLRVLRLAGVGAVADGGTIVKNAGEVGVVKIERIEVKEGNTVVYYNI